MALRFNAPSPLFFGFLRFGIFFYIIVLPLSLEIRWRIIVVVVVVVVVVFCCLRLVEFFVRGNDCTHFKTLFLRTDVRVRSEIVWGCRIRVVMIRAV